MVSPGSYDACRRIWKRLLRKVISSTGDEWRTPWFGEYYGNGDLIRDTGVICTAIKADWSRGISIEQIPGQDTAVAFHFALCWVSIPGGSKAPGARRLAIRSTQSLESRRIVEALLRAWIVDGSSEVKLVAMGEPLGVVTSPEALKAYTRELEKQSPSCRP